jgi:hypothetical protein
MKLQIEIDFSKLLGFALIADHISTAIDLRDNTIGARLGAKVGVKEMTAADLPRDLPHLNTD